MVDIDQEGMMAEDCCCCSSDAENTTLDRQATGFGPVEATAEGEICPTCGEKGRAVQRQTVKSMLGVSLRRMPEAEFLFCDARECSTVYFSLDGLCSFEVHELREQVFQKRPAAQDTLVCYCFNHSVGEVQAASLEGRAAIAEDITWGTKTGQCACELRNPQGSCCLGNVHWLIRNSITLPA